ncbi:Ribosome hibernation promoting factor OS=Tsukamurella paurometabola (strain ATCC 8368 / DSM/ CCUG 35730 / CIP 100753 / JCM 10117 / KCTC 9821 / NBRC 16120/ NCIMB 702349 / NCTC 13040) OX=521096 GN=hpf PE=3 SV=1 [Tsukamurella paurometabola]|uniref:Ribosome hibernation promoting factor n=1 Tax=Tsukamurella paurometabola (strain ATCC 8368 / DSM 20162 / CCUG 35730 / CIP 100753 / JCM 10117 / KCTC 9821 / NBRC 16120 / NCIMB 702349 / NCTC 13040) TaxID=521096 RepID=D5UVC2_TSUPD|nr:ribosome-associated translation inhibitor RaiA [Tsukamurella paurometabola]ADG77712.1 sigma 54 modulation protein/ribosomal protein S30EA [Tsukamurella paurometabola DSM 20162]SUP28417.1 ribosome hibernation promoting factor HPF [Tsukamurella paurometabola]
MTLLSSRDTNRNGASTVEVDPFREPSHIADERDKEYLTPNAPLAIDGRNVDVPEHFRVYIGDKLARLEKFRSTITLFEVSLFHEPNPRQSKICQRLELTVRGKGGVARAEAAADNFYAAFETALTKVQSRIRKASDRKKVHYGNRTPVSVSEATAPSALPDASSETDDDPYAALVEDHLPGQVVRIKDHPGTPMTVDDALYQMELVGHDFFLFFDKETEKPSVVYRRKAFDYGLLRLT